MDKKRTSVVFTSIIFTLTAAVIAFAFIHSLMPDYVSQEESLGMLDFLSNILRSLGLGSQLTDHIVRKLAHFTEFSVLGALLTSCAYCFDRFKPYRYITSSFFAGLLTAVLDEAIQLNVLGRSGQITDVLLDFSGILTGSVPALAFYIIYIRLKYKGR